MVSRRFLRIKTFQALYAYFQSEDKSMKKAEKALFLSLEKTYDLYLFLLTVGGELIHHSTLKIEEAKKKRLPTEEDLRPNTKFVDNSIFQLLLRNNRIVEDTKSRKIYWDADQELVSKFLTHLRHHPIYKEYMSTKESSFLEDQKFVVDFYKKIIPEFDLLISEIQDKSIFWGPYEIDFVLSMILKTVKKMNENSDGSEAILTLFKEEEEDVDFVKKLLKETVSLDDKNSEMIAEKTKNWDVERIAIVDVLLMKMALTELLKFKSVPVKVTLNEYIELSKNYSTPKSKVFVNGVLDKLVEDLKNKGELKKIGRGLMEF